MVKTLCLSASLCLVVATATLAGSKGVVSNIRSNDPLNPFCVSFLTQGDATRYGFSLRDPGSMQALVTLNAGRMLNPGPAFTVGDPGPGFNITDCGDGVVYVHSLER